MRRLTLKQRTFAREYIENGGNGTRAALIAYPRATYDSARAIAAENLAKPNVRAELDKHLRAADIDERVIAQTLGDVMDSGNRPAQLQAVRLWLKVMGIPI